MKGVDEMKRVAKKRSTGRKKYSAGKLRPDRKKHDESSASEQKFVHRGDTLASWVAGMRERTRGVTRELWVVGQTAGESIRHRAALLVTVPTVYHPHAGRSQKFRIPTDAVRLEIL